MNLVKLFSMLLLVISLSLLFASSAQAMWPVKPFNGQHAIRGSFMDGRMTDYHHGIDIPVDDTHPDKGAASWASHRVYAVRSGVVSYMLFVNPVSPAVCTSNRFAVGNLIYYHVVPAVGAGQEIRKGQFIGWTCRKRWHIHLTEGFGDQTRNPLRPNGRVVEPYRNTLKPIIENISFYTPCDGHYTMFKRHNVIPNCGRRLGPPAIVHPKPPIKPPVDPVKPPVDPVEPSADNIALNPVAADAKTKGAIARKVATKDTIISGLVDVRYDAYEPQPTKLGIFKILPWLYSPIQPYSANLKVMRVNRHGMAIKTVVSRNIYTADWLRRQKPLTVHWAPGFQRWLGLADCAGHVGHMQLKKCKGRWVFRAFATDNGKSYGRYWNTKEVPNGRYRIRIGVTTHTGQKTFQGIYVTVKNKGHRTKSVIEQPAGNESRYKPAVDDSYQNETAADIAAYALVSR